MDPIKNLSTPCERMAMMLRSRMTVSSCVTDLGAKILGATAALLLATFPSAAGELEAPVAYVETDCRYVSDDPQAARDSAPLGKKWFPHGDIFRPLLADIKQPRFYLSPRRVEFRSGGLPGGGQDDSITAGLVGMGKDLGIFRRSQRNRCDGLQVDLLGAVFSQFNLDASSDDLINSDFLVGPELMLRRGFASVRLRLYHQSSHLGDEFLLNNPGVDRVDLSFEVFDALVSFEGRWWRLYGGGGYISDNEIDAGLAQGGFELRVLGRRWQNARGTAVFGADFQSLEERHWNVNASLMSGIEFSNPAGTHRFRVLLAYLRGTVPFGQFFNTEKVRSYGLQLQFDF